MQRLGTDTIKYYFLPETPYGNLTKIQGNNTQEGAKKSAFSQLVTTGLQGTDKTRKYNKDKRETFIKKNDPKKEALPWNVQ